MFDVVAEGHGNLTALMLEDLSKARGSTPHSRWSFQRARPPAFESAPLIWARDQRTSGPLLSSTIRRFSRHFVRLLMRLATE